MWLYGSTPDGHTPDGSDTLLSRQVSNWRLPAAQHPVPYYLNTFLIVLAPGQTLTAVFCSRITAREPWSNILLALDDEQVFLSNQSDKLLIQGILYGAILLIFCFGFAFLLATRQLMYVVYCLYAVTRLCHTFLINDTFSQLIDQPGWLADPTTGFVTVVLAVIFHSSFYLRFIGFRAFGPDWLWWFMNSLTVVIFLLAIGLAWQPTSDTLFALASRVTNTYIVLTLGCLALGLYYRRPEVRLIGVALTPMVLYWVYELTAGRLLPVYHGIFEWGLYLWLVFEMVTLGIGLVYRFNADRRRILVTLNNTTRENARQVILAQEQERQQIAANLHDDLGGTLATLHGELSRKNEQLHNQLLTALQLTQQATHDLRLIAHHLMPTTFAQIGLSQAIQETVDLADQQSSTRVLLVSPGPQRRLAPEVEINAYRILRELLTNALRHAQASRIVVQLIFYPHFLYISVEDNGKGIQAGPDQPGTATNSRPGIGMKNIRSRATFLRAILITETSPAGTLIALEIPYDTPDPTLAPADPYSAGR